jgi:fumarate reductase flavoprotein subunit
MESPAETYDVVVVGAGGSGLAAAASAAENGARVLVLEKQPEPGGATGLAVGSFTTSETAFQRKAGIEDRTEDHVEDAALFAPAELEARNCEKLRALLIRNSRDTLEWLVGMGLTFHGPTPEPPNRVPRMHNVVPGARAYVLALAKRMGRHGAAIRCGARARELMQEDGRVSGVRAEVDGHIREFRARKGVVLAAGDYASSPELIAKHKGPEFSEIEGIYPFAHGDGHRLSEAAGAQLINMDVTYGPEFRFVPPAKLTLLKRLPAGGILRTIQGKLMPFAPKPIMNAIIKRELVTWQHPEDAIFAAGAILVNAEGNRFCNEIESPAREIAISRQPGKIGYVLLDQRLIEHFAAWPNYISTAPEIAYAYVQDYLRLRPDVAFERVSLEGIAAARGLPAAALVGSVESFNRAATGKADDPFGRTDGSQALTGNRWVLLGPAKAYFTITEGSPAINEHMEVLDGPGQPIPGLYAAGQNGLGGQILWGHGLHIAWAITSGRLVGRALAREEAPR